MTAPIKILTENFEEFLEKCEKYKEDLLKGNSAELWKEILSGFCSTQALKQSLEGYSIWMDQSWVRELILNALSHYNGNYDVAETYVQAWLNEKTYRLYKLFSILAPLHIYDDPKKIIAYIKYKGILINDQARRNLPQHWNSLFNLYREGKFIPIANAGLYKFDLGTLEEYISWTKNMSKQISQSISEKPSAELILRHIILEDESTSLPSNFGTMKIPKKILTENFGDFLRKCENYKEDLLNGNKVQLWREILKEFCNTPEMKRSLERYSMWMDQSWIRELLLNALTHYKGNYTGAVACLSVWSYEITYRIHKLFSILAPEHINDEQTNIVTYASCKKIANKSIIYDFMRRYWNILIQLYQQGKFISIANASIYEFDMGTLDEYVSMTKQMSRSDAPSAVPVSTPSATNARAKGSKRPSETTLSSSVAQSTSSSPSVKKSCLSTADSVALNSLDSKELAVAPQKTSESQTSSSPDQGRVSINKEPPIADSSVNNVAREFLSVMTAVEHLPVETQNLVALHMIKAGCVNKV